MNAESFAEQVNAIAKLIMTDDSTLLTEKLLNKLVTLRINAGFMEHMRDNYSAHIKVEQPFGMTVVRDDEYITSYLANTSLLHLFFISISHQHQLLEPC